MRIRVWDGVAEQEMEERITPISFFTSASYWASVKPLQPNVRKPQRSPHAKSSFVGPSAFTASMFS